MNKSNDFHNRQTSYTANLYRLECGFNADKFDLGPRKRFLAYGWIRNWLLYHKISSDGLTRSN